MSGRLFLSLAHTPSLVLGVWNVIVTFPVQEVVQGGEVSLPAGEEGPQSHAFASGATANVEIPASPSLFHHGFGTEMYRSTVQGLRWCGGHCYSRILLLSGTCACPNEQKALLCQGSVSET